MASELLPCPFCNSDRITVHNIRDGQQAVCKDCGSHGKPVFHGPKGPEATWGEAVAAWNTRPAPVDANPLASNPVDDKIAPDTDGNAPVAVGDSFAQYLERSCAEAIKSYNETPLSLRGPVVLPFDDERIKPPAPAATDTGLVAVGYAHRGTIGLLLEGAVGKAVIVPKAGGDFRTPVMLVEQADELLAENAELKKDRRFKQHVIDGLVVEKENLKADNAAKDARIKGKDAYIEELANTIIDLEAKLAAAEKALEAIEDHAARCFSLSTHSTIALAYLQDIQDEARAVLGGKPS
ncbi:Lar family restriction alleviation protein [Brucella tritici]|nr:Lar family restriction alleviation protein [Brucella tritici]